MKGPSFIGLHELFDKVSADVGNYVDMIAERITQLGGIAEGTVRVSAAQAHDVASIKGVQTLADYLHYINELA